MEAVEAQKYYTRLGISAGDVMQRPANFDQLLDRFFTLAPVNREAFLRSCFWFSSYNRAHSYSRSAGFTALITTMEALMAPDKPLSKCETCGRNVGKRARRRCAEFIDRYAPTAEPFVAARKRLYAIRSALSHGGALLPSDRYIFQPSLTPERAEEIEDFSTIWGLVGVVLVNWLLDHGDPANATRNSGASK